LACYVKREPAVTAAVIDLDALADAVRPAAEDDDLLLVRWRALVRRRARERRFIGRIHGGCRGGEFARTGVDTLVSRANVERVALRRHLGLRRLREHGK